MELGVCPISRVAFTALPRNPSLHFAGRFKTVIKTSSNSENLQVSFFFFLPYNLKKAETSLVLATVTFIPTSCIPLPGGKGKNFIYVFVF